MKNYTILVNTCDAYEDLWIPFFTLLKKYWVGEMPPIILNTENEQFYFEGIDIVCCNCTDNPYKYYGKRIKNALKSIKTPYVFSILDDFFLRSPVEIEKLEKTIEYMENNRNIACFNFENCLNGHQSEKYPGYQYLPQIANYKLNMQAAMWRTEDLYNLWKDKESPWEWESIGNKRTFFLQQEFYFLNKGCVMPFNYGKKEGPTWGVVGGKWVKEDVDLLFEENNIQVDFEKRGLFVAGSATHIQKDCISHFKIFNNLIYSVGLGFAVKNLYYSIITRKFKGIAGTENDEDYMQYLANKYNK